MIELDLSIKEKIKEKLFPFLKHFLGEALSEVIEIGFWGILLKFYFGLHWKNLVAIIILIFLLSAFKKGYYKEDMFLAFAILMLFQDNILLAWFLFIYISYFRGITGFYIEENRKSEKFSKLKSKAFGFIGQYIAPFLLLFVARKNKDLKDNLFFLVFLWFLHHLNYYLLLILDIIFHKKDYSIKEAKELFSNALKETKINFIITAILFILFKNIIITFVYNIVSWGYLDYFFEILALIF
ncbi:MAG: hypothetical protein QXR96_01935 [Candidatus Woesearchaeota archaeon]